VTKELLIDRVLVDLNISHSRVSDLTVELTSPAGTKAVLIARPSNGTGSGIVFETSANNFWGEETDGVWTLTVTDSRSSYTGRLNSWTLKAVGDAPSADNLYVYTGEYAGGKTLSDSNGGTDTINLAAVPGAVVLDLASETLQTSSTVAGKDLFIAAGTLIEKVYLGDGDDVVTGNASNNFISGGRGADDISGLDGDDILIGGAGADYLRGGAGSDVFDFESLWDSWALAVDAITDFQLTADGLTGDRIDLSKIDAAASISGDDQFSFIGNSDAFSGQGQLRYEALDGGGIKLLGNVDSDTDAEFVLVVANLKGITAEHFLV
jgi:subtilisin-like proprotein convertase family protein